MEVPTQVEIQRSQNPLKSTPKRKINSHNTSNSNPVENLENLRLATPSLQPERKQLLPTSANKQNRERERERERKAKNKREDRRRRGKCERTRGRKKNGRNGETSAARFNSTLMQSARSSAAVGEGYYPSLAEIQQPVERSRGRRSAKELSPRRT